MMFRMMVFGSPMNGRQSRWTLAFVVADDSQAASQLWEAAHPETHGWIPIEWTADVPAHVNGVPVEIIDHAAAAQLLGERIRQARVLLTDAERKRLFKPVLL